MLFVSSCKEWVRDWKPCWCKSTGWGDGESLDQYALFLYCMRTCSEHHCSLQFQKDKDMVWFNVMPAKGQCSQWSADSVNQAIATRSTLYKINDGLNIALMTKISIHGVQILPPLQPNPHPSEIHLQPSADPSISICRLSINGWELDNLQIAYLMLDPSLTTKFHQMQGIDLILQYWDSTKYASIGI